MEVFILLLCYSALVSSPPGEDCSSAFLKLLIIFTSGNYQQRCTKHKSRVGTELFRCGCNQRPFLSIWNGARTSMGLETSLEFVVICCLCCRSAWLHINKFPGQQTQSEQRHNIKIQSCLRTSIFLCFYLILQWVEFCCFPHKLNSHTHPSLFIGSEVISNRKMFMGHISIKSFTSQG